jgi:hypothetical protein
MGRTTATSLESVSRSDSAPIDRNISPGSRPLELDTEAARPGGPSVADTAVHRMARHEGEGDVQRTVFAVRVAGSTDGMTAPTPAWEAGSGGDGEAGPYPEGR